eukprot:c13574_g1_i1 orf=208-771(+)
MAQQNSHDDVEPWDLADEDAEEIGSSSLDLHREWTSRQAHFHTLGYRDGIEEGKKSSVQQGFEAGYQQGVKVGLNCGLARGWAGAFTALPNSIQNLLLDDTAKMQVDKSNAALSSISSDKAAYIFYQNISNMNNPEGRVKSANDTVGDDLLKEKDVSASTPRLDSSVNVEKIHLELQSLMRSSGVIQ